MKRYTDAEVVLLNAIEHARACKWFDDQDWNSATFTNYMRNHNDYPECTCDLGRAALQSADKKAGAP